MTLTGSRRGANVQLEQRCAPAGAKGCAGQVQVRPPRARMRGSARRQGACAHVSSLVVLWRRYVVFSGGRLKSWEPIAGDRVMIPNARVVTVTDIFARPPRHPERRVETGAHSTLTQRAQSAPVEVTVPVSGARAADAATASAASARTAPSPSVALAEDAPAPGSAATGAVLRGARCALSSHAAGCAQIRVLSQRAWPSQPRRPPQPPRRPSPRPLRQPPRRRQVGKPAGTR